MKAKDATSSDKRMMKLAKFYAKNAVQFTWLIGYFAKEVVRLNEAIASIEPLEEDK